MSDLIRREDAARIAEDHNLDIWEYSTGNRSRIGHDPVAEAIRALPAVHIGKEVMPDVSNDAPNEPDAAPASNMTAGGGAKKMALCDAIMTGMGVLRVTSGGGATREEVAEALWIADKNGFDAQLRSRFADIESYNRNHWLKLADVAIKTIKGEKK